MQTLSRWCIAHRRAVIAGWVVLAIGITVIASAVGRQYANDFSLPNTESQHVVNLLKSEFPAQGGDVDQIVFNTTKGTVQSPAVRNAIEPLLKQVQTMPHVASVTSPYTPAGKFEISKDGRTAFATVTYTKRANLLPNDTGKPVLDAIGKIHVPGLKVAAGGQVIESAEGFSVGPATAVGVVAAFIILLLTFGSLLAAGMPLITAGLGLITGVALIGLGDARHQHVEHLARTGADDRPRRRDRLRVVHRHPLPPELRREPGHRGLDHGGDGHLRSRGPVGRVDGGDRAARDVRHRRDVHVRALDRVDPGGPAGAGVVADRAPGAADVLRAAPGQADPPRASACRRAARPNGRHGGGEWSLTVQRHPRVLALASLLVMLAFIAPVLAMRLDSSDAGNDPSGKSTRVAFDLLAAGFGPGFNGPLLIAGELNGANAKANVGQLRAAVASTPGVVAVTAPQVSPSGKVAVFQAYPATAPQAEATTKLVNHLRDDVLPPLQSKLGITALVGGFTAGSIDFSHVLAQKLPLFIAIVVVLSALLLFVIFRSLVIPLQAAVMNLLSIGGALGATVLVFQDGWLRRPVRGREGADRAVGSGDHVRGRVRLVDGLRGVSDLPRARGMGARARRLARRRPTGSRSPAA